MRRRKTAKRKGMTIVVAVVCLVVVTLLLASMMRLLRTATASSQLQLHGLQSEWLVVAGEQRARQQVNQTPDYLGESWTFKAPNEESTMQITITRLDDRTQLQVTTDISRGDRRIVRATRNIPIKTGTSDEE